MDPAVRSSDPKAVKKALAAITAPPGKDVEREVLAIAFAHKDGAVRKAAMTIAEARIKDTKLVRAKLGTRFHSDYASKASAALRTVERADRGELATAMVARGANVHGVALEEDRAFAKEAVYRQLIAKENKLDLGHLDGEDVELTTIPDVVFDELKGLRKKVPFDWIYVWGGEMPGLPKRFVELAPFLRK